eukprot:361871-Chlamydomonas_euryale.AAC.13
MVMPLRHTRPRSIYAGCSAHELCMAHGVVGHEPAHLRINAAFFSAACCVSEGVDSQRRA